MTSIERLEKLRSLIKELYSCQQALKENSPIKLDFTLDGKLVGDLGKCYASIAFGLKKKEIEGSEYFQTIAPQARTIEIHTTQGEGTIYIGSGDGPPRDILIFHLDDEARFRTIYNGPRAFMQSRGMAVSTLSNRWAGVPEDQRLRPLPEAAEWVLPYRR